MNQLKSILLSIFCLVLFSVYSCKDGQEEQPCTETTWYQDADGDGLGNPAITFVSCQAPAGYVANSGDNDDTQPIDNGNNNGGGTNVSAVEQTFNGRIDLSNLLNYENQTLPSYILKDNNGNNGITNEGATLGRVLFYDKNLSVNNTIACASCHKQAFAFGDGQLQSDGVAGVTGRHAMRLVNARFADERHFFWDERANTLEDQTTMPIQNHVEMGFSGQNGDPGINDLIQKLQAIPYYQELFTFVYGDPAVTEQRIQRAMAQFIRSIQSFDSKFDQGRAQVNNDVAPFPNYSQQENLGKNVFFTPPNQGGAGCQGCHRAPEFDIDPNSRNNNVVGNLDSPNSIDVTITRSPSLRDLVKTNGQLNGPLMHDGSLASLEAVVEHYNFISIVPGNNNIDPRLRQGGPPGPGNPPNPNGQQLNLSDQNKAALVAFLKTLSGSSVYTDERWSDPFQ